MWTLIKVQFSSFSLKIWICVCQACVKTASSWPKNVCVSIAQELLDYIKDDDNLFKTVKISDKSWACGYDPKIETRSSQWKTSNISRLKKVQMSQNNVKTVNSFLWLQGHCSLILSATCSDSKQTVLPWCVVGYCS